MFAHLIVIWLEQISSNWYFKRIWVVNIYQKQTNGYCTKQSSDIRQNLVNFLKTSFVNQRYRRLIEVKSSVEGSSVRGINRIPIFDTIFRYNSTFVLFFFCQRNNTLISFYCIILKHYLTFLPIICRKHYIIAILQIMTQIFRLFSINQRIYEVNCIVKIGLICKQIVDHIIWSTRMLEKWRVCTTTYWYF